MTDPAAPMIVLVVDDEDAVRDALHRYLVRSGYQAVEAGDAEQALARLDAIRVGAMVCDIRMPGMSGIDLLPKALAREPDLAVIMLTGVGEPQAAIQCLKRGAADYLLKPVDLEELGLALHYALRKRELEIERRETEQWLAREVALKTRDLEKQKRQVEVLSLTVLRALVDVLETKDAAGRGHSARVADLSVRLAAALGLGGGAVETIRTAARLHDIGHIAIRDEVLRNASAHAVPELVTAQDAPGLAERILEPLTHHADVVDILRLQHERYDGRGHPEGRRGEEIPVGARIVAAANLYDELTAASPDRLALSPADAVENLRAVVGMLLDPAVFAALERVVLERP